MLTLPVKEVKGNQAVCGRSRQFRAVDVTAAKTEAECERGPVTDDCLLGQCETLEHVVTKRVCCAGA